MSFGFGVADVLTLVQLAYATFDGAKKACGEHDELTQEMSSLVTVLDQVQSEISDPESPINMARGHRRKELENHVEGCLRHVRQMNAILTKFNALSNAERGSGPLWQKVRFGNGAVKDIAQIRIKISTYTTAITISLTLLSLGSRGEAERQLSRQRGQLRGITESINLLVAKMNSPAYEGSIWTKCTDDDVDFWRDFRRQLVKKGYKSRVIRNHQSLIQAYVRELESSGVFDGESRQSQSNPVAESESEDSRLPEAGVDQVELEVSAHPGEGPELENQGIDISGPSIVHESWRDRANTSNPARHHPKATVEDFEQLSDFDQRQGEEPDQPMDDDNHEKEEAWQEEFEGENLDDERFSLGTRKMAQENEYMEQLGREQQQSSHTLSFGEETMQEQTGINKLIPLSTNRHLENSMPSSYGDRLQTSDSDRSHQSELQAITMDNISGTNEKSNRNDETSFNRESLAETGDQAFNALSSEEKRLSITMQAPSGRKYSLPYFLVKTWDVSFSSVVTNTHA
jgi:Fungal N-terminal domain of STAND proteins